jgi:hypothetical protein
VPVIRKDIGHFYWDGNLPRVMRLGSEFWWIEEARNTRPSPLTRPLHHLYQDFPGFLGTAHFSQKRHANSPHAL